MLIILFVIIGILTSYLFSVLMFDATHITSSDYVMGLVFGAAFWFLTII